MNLSPESSSASQSISESGSQSEVAASGSTLGSPLGATASDHVASDTRIRFRAYGIGLPLLIGICILSVYADMKAQVVQVGVMQLAPPAVATLLILALITRIAYKRKKDNVLSGGELAVIYVMSLIATLVSTRGVMEKLIPSLMYLPYYANRENRLNEILTQHLPAWAMPFIPTATPGAPPPQVAGYWEGNGGVVPWSFWIGPLFAWFALIACVLWVFLCLATILRRQWIDHEQLRFPLTTLPLAMIKDEIEGEPFYRNRLMWMGFAAAFGILFVNGLHANFPDVPFLGLVYDFVPYLTEKPWNTMQGAPIFLSFAAIGFAYFLPADLLFSLWFFYGLTRLQDVGITLSGGVPTGTGTHGNNVFQAYQAAGAYLAFIAVQVRLTWPYLKKVLGAAAGKSTLDDRDELMSYQSAVWGAVLAFVGIVVWLSVAGMSPVLAAAQMGLFLFFIAVMMTRAVAEAGMLGTETSFMPSHLINLVHPLPAFGAPSLTMLGLTDSVFTRDLRGTLFSVFLDGQKITKELGMRPRQLLRPIIIASVLSFGVAAAFFLWLHYSHGALSLYSYPKWNATNLFGRAAGAINGNAPPADGLAYGGVFMGAVVMSVLMWMRTQFLWWPFHPLGYALAPMGTMNVYWFPFLVAWVIKTQVLRFGGVETYRKLAPFMLGLILGEFSSGIFWMLGNMARGWAVPPFPWP